MSFDPNAETSPTTDFEQPKSGKKWWLFGCGGCAVVLILCCGGGGFALYSISKPLQDIMRESQEFARSSEVVADALGEPISVSDEPIQAFPEQTAENGVSYLGYRYVITGSEKSGELLLKIAIKDGFKFERESLSLELEDGTIIDLSPDEEFNLDIDMGDGTDEPE